MSKKYSKRIAEGNYSRIDFKWAPFSEEDKNMVDEGLSK
jgi:hypothetical protein